MNGAPGVAAVEEVDDRVGGEGDVARHREDQLVAACHLDVGDEARRGVEHGELVHLHAVEVRMPDHQRRPPGALRVALAELHPHLAHPGHRLGVADGDRRRAAAGALHEDGVGEHRAVRGGRDRVHVGVAVDAHPEPELARVAGRAEADLRRDRAGVLVDDDAEPGHAGVGVGGDRSPAPARSRGRALGASRVTTVSVGAISASSPKISRGQVLPALDAVGLHVAGGERRRRRGGEAGREDQGRAVAWSSSYSHSSSL